METAARTSESEEVMERRKLLKSIAFLPGLMAIPTIPALSQLAGKYRGFKIIWRGWFELVNQHIVIGQWIAYRENDPYRWHVYSGYPGATGRCFPGYIFDTSVRGNQEYPGPWSTPEQLESYRQDALGRLIRYINEHYEELVH
jgi:hypothetical protein